MKTEAQILIAEDNVMNQLLIKHLLRSRGYKFDLVFNGAEAVETLKRQSYDLILMDILLRSKSARHYDRIFPSLP